MKNLEIPLWEIWFSYGKHSDVRNHSLHVNAYTIRQAIEIAEKWYVHTHCESEVESPEPCVIQAKMITGWSVLPEDYNNDDERAL